jgi:glycosyltransferase involved in cell wall biosynthesis
VFNGYDEQDIPAIYDQPTEKFELCHVGNFFPYMDVPALWQTLASLCAQRDDFRRMLRLNFTGLLDPVVHRNIVEAGLGEHLYLPGAVNHKKATETMAKANLLLFVIPNIENNALVVTGKIFEYLACRSEILPIGNVNSNVSGILRHCNANQMVDYNDGAAMQKIIIGAFKNWLNNKGKSPKSLSTSVENYSRRALTRSISDILNQIAS